MEKTGLEDGMNDELSRLESMDREFLAKVDRFLEEQSLNRAQAPETAKTTPKRREIGFVWQVFDDETLANITLGLMSAATVGLPFLVYYVLKSLGVPNINDGSTSFISVAGLCILNMVIWCPKWPKNLLWNIVNGLRHRHYLKVAKTVPEATLYDIVALNNATIFESYPDCNIVRLKSGQFLRLKPIYAKIFSGKGSLRLEYISDYVKNIMLVKDSLKDISNK
jgi:hypothetical protein